MPDTELTASKPTVITVAVNRLNLNELVAEISPAEEEEDRFRFPRRETRRRIHRSESHADGSTAGAGTLRQGLQPAPESVCEGLRPAPG